MNKHLPAGGKPLRWQKEVVFCLHGHPQPQPKGRTRVCSLQYLHTSIVSRATRIESIALAQLIKHRLEEASVAFLVPVRAVQQHSSIFKVVHRVPENIVDIPHGLPCEFRKRHVVTEVGEIRHCQNPCEHHELLVFRVLVPLLEVTLPHRVHVADSDGRKVDLFFRHHSHDGVHLILEVFQNHRYRRSDQDGQSGKDQKCPGNPTNLVEVRRCVPQAMDGGGIGESVPGFRHSLALF